MRMGTKKIRICEDMEKIALTGSVCKQTKCVIIIGPAVIEGSVTLSHSEMH